MEPEKAESRVSVYLAEMRCTLREVRAKQCWALHLHVRWFGDAGSGVTFFTALTMTSEEKGAD
jgi:hypothetical protein